MPGSVVAVYKAVNVYRVQNGLPELQFSGKLVLAAMGHSKDMATNGFFSHNNPSPGKATVWDRAESHGYDWAEVSENIFRSSQSEDEQIADEALRAWSESEGHRANLLDPTVKDIGVGVARYPDGSYAVTVVMGREF